MGSIESSILDSIEILLNKKVSTLSFNKTVRATVISVQNAALNKYVVKYQDAKFYAYASDSQTTYKANDQVYVLIPNDDYNTTKLIIGTVTELGTKYLTAISSEGKMTRIGTNIFNSKNSVSFCSYNGAQTNSLLNDEVSINLTDLNVYKTDRKSFLLGGTFQTKLNTQQQAGGGDYGYIVEADYYSGAYKDQQSAQIITRTYVLNVDQFLGQPYKLSVPTRQYAIFSIDGTNLKEIKSITAYCKDFPVTEEGHSNDIFMSDFQMYFLEALTDEELSGASLKILTPNGGYLTSANDNTRYLEAQLKIKGKNVTDDSSIKYYWFVKDTTVTTSDSKNYSLYGGAGWRCLNQFQTSSDGSVTYFSPETKQKYILPTYVPAKTTTFKCVALYNDEIFSATIDILNQASLYDLSISSSAGTKFYFDTGITTLKCGRSDGSTIPNAVYYWGYRGTDGNLNSINEQTQSIEINVGQATDVVTYECTVYSNGKYYGSAAITLTNGVPDGEFTLVINNGTQVFKYDSYGTSPASPSAAAANRITLSALSFDIYDDTGRLIKFQDETQKTNSCNSITWVMPDSDNSMLQFEGDVEELIVSPATNGNISRQVIYGSMLYYTIKNKYDITATDNNIKLEVDYHGKVLMASTNFTFVKEGQNGTNGTEYVARVVPVNNKYEQVYIQNGKLLGWYETVTKTYNATTGKNDVTDTYTFDTLSSIPLKAQLWSGAQGSIYSFTSDSRLAWQMVNVGSSKTRNATINNSTGAITPLNTYTSIPTIVKATITTNELSPLAKKYFASYPLDVVKTPSSEYHAIVTGGFSECMYQSDGTRSSFNSTPFTFRIIQNSKERAVNAPQITWTVSWYTTAKNNALKGKNGVTIEPPAYYNSQSVDNYITVTYGSYTLVLSVYFYLNRYGLAAMNDWDGTSIKLNKDGDQYILAPQIGAGQKNSANQFTGMTMGKSFNVDSSNTTQIGLMGFNQGARSIFLDAQTGNAIFGLATGPQIVIAPTKWGIAPLGAIYSSSYYTRDKTGKPTALAKAGMLIDLETPSIQFGTGNFSVTKDGYLTAKGGGSIAGWNISDTSLTKGNVGISSDNSTATNLAFWAGANKQFSVDFNGKITSTSGTIGGWTIQTDSLHTSGKTAYGSGTGVYLGSNGTLDIGSASAYLRYNDGVEVKGNIRGSKIYASEIYGGDDIPLEATGDEVKIGDFVVLNTNRDLFESSDERVGMSGDSTKDDRNYYLWAGWHRAGSDTDFYVNQAGNTYIRRVAGTSHWANYSLDQIIDYIWGNSTYGLEALHKRVEDAYDLALAAYNSSDDDEEG